MPTDPAAHRSRRRAVPAQVLLAVAVAVALALSVAFGGGRHPVWEAGRPTPHDPRVTARRSRGVGASSARGGGRHAVVPATAVRPC